VQPADPLEAWRSPPFEPEVRDGRLYGRGAADNKGPMMVHIAGVARALERNPSLPLRITFVIEGEEEIGSPSFADILQRHSDRLRGDFVLLSDTSSPSPEQLAITTGLRGMVCLDIAVEGPRSDLHSGVHGGAVLNPVQALAALCASLHDADGWVDVPGFYDRVVGARAWEREEIAKLGSDDSDYLELLGAPAFHTVDGLRPGAATRLMPTLEFNGIGGGYQGEGSKTIIPSRAFAKVSCRLVPEQDPVEIEEQLIRTLHERCSPKVRLSVHPGHRAAPYQVVPSGREGASSDINPCLARAFDAADRSIAEVFGKPPLYLREGGSIPIIAEVRRLLDMDSLMIGMFTPDNNVHAPDENLHLEMFERGITVSARIVESAGMAP